MDGLCIRENVGVEAAMGNGTTEVMESVLSSFGEEEFGFVFDFLFT